MTKNTSSKKTILYYISTAVVLRDKELMLEKIEKNCDVFSDNSDRISIVWMIQSDCREKLEIFFPELLPRFDHAVELLSKTGSRLEESDDKTDTCYDECDAFYGDWSYAAWRCLKQKKPVMIQSAMV